jgi:transcriptional regulator with XRE-family HTH domain
MSDTRTQEQAQETSWTPHLIRQLRGKRTQAAFGALLGAAKSTVWRWEAGQVRPDARYAARLTELAAHEHFRYDWQLVGSMSLHGDLENATADALFRTSLERTSHQLMA